MIEKVTYVKNFLDLDMYLQNITWINTRAKNVTLSLTG